MVAGIEVKPTCPEAAAPNQVMPTANTANSRLMARIQRLRMPSLNSLRAILKICFIAVLPPHPRHWPFPYRNDRCLPDRKSTRLNSSHVRISYAVFCLKKKKKNKKKIDASHTKH